jgi:serine/threonine protein kinase
MKSAMAASVPGLPVPGELLAGKYRVERILGVGGMGVVVAARHLDLDERVAVKFLLPHVPAHGEPVARFLREARAAIKIRSEHVVRIFDVGRLDNGAPYIVMEYLEGCDLSQLVTKGGTLAADLAVTYVLHACEAIAAAHSLGVIHRDLKPANLFLTTSPDGTPCVKVLDFGISKINEAVGARSGSAGGAEREAESGLTSTTTIMGTPCFMSPEQLRSTRDVDERTDIWSLGAILYALLAGSPPYDGESNADVSAKIIRDDPPPLRSIRPDVPEGVEAVVHRCLEKNPDKRFADVLELAKALGELGSEEAKRKVLRIARIATAVAPTMKSSSSPSGGAARIASARGRPEDLIVDAHSSAGDNPTRTASSWGETSGVDKKRRVLPLGALVVAACAMAAAVAFGIVKIGNKAPVVEAVSASSIEGARAPIEAPPPVVVGTLPALPAPTPAIATSASASATPSAITSATSAPPASPSHAKAATGAKLKPASSASAPLKGAASAKPGGLFDDRE